LHNTVNIAKTIQSSPRN